MRRTAQRVRETWQWDRSWGWDFPMAAMAAARTGQPELALDFLLLDTPKNRYLPNGHNYQRPDLPAYLPANGGLLAATAMMCAGWTGGPNESAPGFPKRWQMVRAMGKSAAMDVMRRDVPGDVIYRRFTVTYSRTVAFNCALNASTIFVCAALTSASVKVFSGER